MEKYLRLIVLLLVWFLCGIASLSAQNYYTTLDRVESWLDGRYPPNSLTYKARRKDLVKIMESEGTDSEKEKKLRSMFPEAFLKMELPLIFQKTLNWNIHSLALGYDIQDITTKSIRTVDVLKEVATSKNSEENSRQDTSTKRRETRKSLKVEGNAKFGITFNPLKWFSNKAQIELQGSYGTGTGEDSTSTSNELWSKSNQRVFSREHAQIFEMLRKQDISHFHLTFTVTLTNNTNKYMTCDLGTASIPVYMGNRSCNKHAIPHEIKSPRMNIEPHRTKDIVFRMELDTTTARELADFMAKAAPTIAFMKGNFKITSPNSDDVIGDSVKPVSVIPVKMQIADFHAEWNIRQIHTSDFHQTTIREAMSAISDDIRQWKGYDIFRWKGKDLDTISEVPLGSFAKEDINEHYMAFLQFGNQVVDSISSEELDRPLPSAGVTFWVIDLVKFHEKPDLPDVVQETVIKKIKKLAEHGNKNYQLRLAIMYEDGRSIGKNKGEAVKWWRKSAEQGNARAQYNLGNIYFLGDGVNKDFGEAVKWWRKSAEQGYADAQFSLGFCYEFGKNQEEAVKWYHKAAAQGEPNAQYSLGVCYEHGRGVAKNPEEAVKWYRKAAEQGEPNAQYRLGVCYQYGEGVAKDPEEAVKWYRKAAEQGDEFAKKELKRLGL